MWYWEEKGWDKRRGEEREERSKKHRNAGRGVKGGEGTVMGRTITLERTKSRISYWRKKNDLLLYCHLN